jgi:hypothetical protein
MLEQAVVGEVRRGCLRGAHNDVERNVVVYDFRDARGGVQGCIFSIITSRSTSLLTVSSP